MNKYFLALVLGTLAFAQAPKAAAPAPAPEVLSGVSTALRTTAPKAAVKPVKKHKAPKKAKKAKKVVVAPKAAVKPVKKEVVK